jgi:hypothetical protein
MHCRQSIKDNNQQNQRTSCFSISNNQEVNTTLGHVAHNPVAAAATL